MILSIKLLFEEQIITEISEKILEKVLLANDENFVCVSSEDASTKLTLINADQTPGLKIPKFITAFESSFNTAFESKDMTVKLN